MSYSDLSNEFGGANSAVGTGGAKSYTVAGQYAYIVPPGVTSLQVLIVGGGGGGALGVAASGYCAALGSGGGGGGEVTYNPAIVVTPGETLTITVGAGGAANVGSGGASSLVGLSGTTSAGGGGPGFGLTGGGSTYTGGYGVVAGGAGGGGGSAVQGSNGVGVQGGAGGLASSPFYPGLSISLIAGGGGGGGSTTGTPSSGGGPAGWGIGGNNSSAAIQGLDGHGGGGGGGGGSAPFLNGARGGNGGVYFYAPATRANVNIENYYRGQGYVPDISRNSSIPYWNGSGVRPSITVGTDFYNATNLFYWNYVVGSGLYAQGLCVLAAATADGYLNDKPLIATITINGVLGATATGTYALDTGTGYNTPPTITVTVGASGFITGHGGGSLVCSGGSVVGGDGGTAINLQVPVSITNNGIIQGGGAAAAPERGVYPGGSGYGFGIGVQGNLGTVNQNGTLESGGTQQSQQTGKKSSGTSGFGGGWVSEAGQSYTTNGYATTGGYIPGNGFTAGSVANLTLVVHGTIRGLCGL
jgi:hypothetical protein